MRLRREFLIGLFVALVLCTGSLLALPAREGTEPTPVLDAKTTELLVTAVVEMQRTAKNLATRVGGLETHLIQLRTRNESLEQANARLRKLLSLETLPEQTWHTYPMDSEVRDANRIIGTLVDKLVSIIPGCSSKAAQSEACENGPATQ